jgi:hypothetical protein
MPFEQFANAASTTMNNGGTLSSGATSVIVTSVTGFPAANFRILIGSEIMLVTAIAGNTLTIARGQDLTTAASHTDGSTVTHVLTALGMLQAIADRNLMGVFASQPAAGVAGRQYNCTDAPFRYVDTGSAWQKFFGTYPLVTPSNAGFSWDNQDGAVLATSYDMLNISNGNNGSISWRYATAPSTPYTIAAAFLPNFNPRNSCYYALGFRATSGKFVAFYINLEGTQLTLNVGEWTNSTTFSTAVVNAVPFYTNTGLVFLQIEDDGTNFTFSVSTDGVNFAQVYQASRTAWLTPAQVCWGFQGDSASSVSLIHWGVGT